MNGIITFSLWGNDPKYLIGAIKNALLLDSIYPNFRGLFFIDANIDKKIINRIANIKNIDVIISNTDIHGKHGAFWRFFPLFQQQYNGVPILFRDVDSRLTIREYTETVKWLNSGKICHSIKDHPNDYQFTLMAGMWSIIGGKIELDYTSMLQWAKDLTYLTDQIYLANEVYPKIANSLYLSSMHDSGDFAQTRSNEHFIGQSYDACEKTIYT